MVQCLTNSDAPVCVLSVISTSQPGLTYAQATRVKTLFIIAFQNTIKTRQALYTLINMKDYHRLIRELLQGGDKHWRNNYTFNSVWGTLAGWGVAGKYLTVRDGGWNRDQQLDIHSRCRPIGVSGRVLNCG